MGRLARAMIRLDSRWHERNPVARPPNGDGVHYLELRHATVRVRMMGAGSRTIVLAPDPPNTIDHYATLMPLLARHFRVIAFEPPGFGFSTPRGHFGFTLDELAELVIELIERLEARRVVLSFACVAAFAALLVARRRPDLVERLVLLQAPSAESLRDWTRREDFLDIIKTPGVGQLALALGKRVVARRWYASACATPGDAERFLRPALDAFDRGASFCLASQFQAFQRGREDFAGVTQDTLVLWGAADGTHRATDGRSLLAQLPQARWAELPGCAHFPDLERPDEYLRHVLGSPGA